jgi:hypothetical protein
MSVILSTTKLKGANVIWANETLILFPAHPKQSQKYEKYDSHIRHVLTVLVDGYRKDIPSTEKELWKLNIIQRGYIHEESFDTEDSYESLMIKSDEEIHNHSISGLYNAILNSATPLRRLIEPVNEKEIRLSLYRPKGSGISKYEDIFSKPARPLKLTKVDSGTVGEGAVSVDSKSGNGVFSWFTVYGSPFLPQIFRCSYITNVALWKPRSSSKYVDNGRTFYREGEFFMENPETVRKEIVKGLREGKLKQVWEELTEGEHIIIKDAFQDLTVMGGDPEVFDYFPIHGSVVSIDNPLGYIKWNLNGEELKTVVQHIFPRSTEDYGKEFSLLVKARLHCDLCPPRDKAISELERIIRESDSYEKFRRRYLGEMP